MNTNTLMLGTIAGRQDEQVRVGYDALASHMHILARTGAGKTTLKKLIFKQVVDAGYGCLFMTPAPDGTWEALALVPKHRVKDIVLIDPGDDLYPFAASPLALQDNRDDRTVNKAVSDAVNRMMHVCKKIWGPGSQEQSWGPQLENVLRNCLYTLILNNLTISELPLLIRDNDFRSLTVSAITDTSQWRWVRWFWQEDFGRWQDRLQIERTDSTLNKVLEFLVNPHIENIVGQRTNTLNFKQWMNEGKQNKIILIRLSENIEGLGEEAVKLLGVMIMAYIKEAVFARERILDKNERKFFPVLCDEFSLYAGDDFKTLLERGRAMNVPFIIGHQAMAQLTSEALREAVNQTVIKVTGQVTEQDAGSFAPLYALPPEAEKYEEKKSEEVSGYRPVLTYKRDVIGHLLAGAAYHKDERVRTFSKEYLRALNYAKEQRVREHQVDTLYGREYVTVLPTRLGFAYDPLDVPPALDTLNDWLYAGMRVSTALWQPLPAETLGWLANFFGFGQLVKLYSFKSEGASYSLPWYRFATKGKFVVDKNNRAGMGKIVRVEVFNRPAFAR